MALHLKGSKMNHHRRILIALGAGTFTGGLASGFAVYAQSSATPARIAIVAPVDAVTTAPRLAAFKQGMHENGLIEGGHYILDVAYADGQYERFPAMTQELLQRNPVLVMSSNIGSMRVLMKATSTVPIVMIVISDPVGNGLVASLARPGGNVTGQASQAEDTMSKYIELLHEALPRAKRIAVLINPGAAKNPILLEQLRSASGGLGMELRLFDALTPADLDAAFAAIARYRPDAMVVTRDSMFMGQPERISAFALKNRIPAFGPISEFVDAGSLLSYSPSLLGMYRSSATFVRKILSGTKPADLPVEQPTRFELVLNQKTAKALGIKIPLSILIRAERVIE